MNLLENTGLLDDTIQKDGNSCDILRLVPKQYVILDREVIESSFLP